MVEEMGRERRGKGGSLRPQRARHCTRDFSSNSPAASHNSWRWSGGEAATPWDPSLGTQSSSVGFGSFM